MAPAFSIVDCQSHVASRSQSRSRYRWRRLKLLRRCFGGAMEENGFHRSSRSVRGLASVAAASPLRRTSLRALSIGGSPA
ncbi:hypothetical protein TIFTF001_036598 [Ficus carica]|uniref:Uncharacterized protein n=1 Tax=Ficus carica TaxID=3494 RepID=A0AA88E4P5_FICCA|nr:hypothetical protein TIFTF001_036598 [Ficus carica]